MGNYTQNIDNGQYNNPFLNEMEKISEEFSAEDKQELRYDNGWSEEKKLRLCGTKTREYLSEDGKDKPFVHFCRIYEKCDECLRYRASEIAKNLELAIQQRMKYDPSVKLRLMQNVPSGETEALRKKIKRAAGDYKRIYTGEDTFNFISVIEDSRTDEEMTKHFGEEMEPGQEYLIDSSDFVLKYLDREIFSIEFFENAILKARKDNVKFSGNLRPEEKEEEEEETERVTFLAASPKTDQDWILKKEIDRFHVPIDEVASIAEMMKDQWDITMARYAAYRAAGMQFEESYVPKNIPLDAFEKWNEAARKNQMSGNAPCENTTWVKNGQKREYENYVDDNGDMINKTEETINARKVAERAKKEANEAREKEAQMVLI